MTRVPNRDGFALAITLLFMLVVTATVAAAVNQASVERSLLDDGDAGLHALVRAEAGLESAIEEWRGSGSPPADGAMLEFELAYGGAEVQLHRLRPEVGNGPAIYAIRSRGVYTRRGRGGSTDAVRTIAQLATWVVGELDIEAGWAALNGLRKNGSSGTISGHDACAEAASIAGAALPDDPGYEQNGSGTPVTGSPAVASLGGTREDAAARVGIDWPSIVDGEVLAPDYVVDATSGWPATGEDEWPIIFIDNPGWTFQFDHSGRGTIIVRGDFEINGGRAWEGVVLVGGQLIMNGDSRIEGAVVSGLNVKLGMDPDPSEAGDIANGNITVQYNSCNVTAALERFSGLQVYDNTWTDSWATY